MILSNKFSQFLLLTRFQNPTGYLLLFLPCLIGTGIHGSFYENYYLISLFFLGSIIMRSAGCIINDLWDRKIDRKVDRTKNRPLASGKIKPIEALIFLAIICSFGLMILLQFSFNAILLGLLSIPFVILYPLMKRMTYWPQIFLGITFNFGILIAEMEINNYITFSGIIIYLGCIFWTLYYDTIYGFMDYIDDKKIGVKSTSLFLLNKNYKLYLFIFGFIAITLIHIGAFVSHHLASAILVSFILSILFLLWQIATLQINLRSNCFLRFKLNVYLGIIWSCMMLI